MIGALQRSLLKIEQKNIYEKIIIMGDININLINRDNIQVENYTNFLIENNLRIISNNITRPNKKGGTLIDHIYLKNIKNKQMKAKYEIEQGTIIDAISDHFPIYINLKEEIKSVSYNITNSQFK